MLHWKQEIWQCCCWWWTSELMGGLWLPSCAPAAPCGQPCAWLHGGLVTSLLSFSLLSSYNGLQVLQSNCPQAMWKMATTSSRSTCIQPEGALKPFGLRPADCSALGKSGNLMPSSLGVRCEKPMIWPVSVFHVHKLWFVILPASRACAWVSGLQDTEAVKPSVWSCWCVEQREVGLFVCF